MVVGAKFRGKIDDAIDKYCLETLSKTTNADKRFAFLTYSSATPARLERVKKYLSDFGFEKIYLTRAGAAITSHCGENCLGILYFDLGQK
jgi:fatty acid-binding protein DegV